MKFVIGALIGFAVVTLYGDIQQNRRIADLEDVVLILSKNHLKQAPRK